MGWRTVVVKNNCKLTYKNNHLVIRNENLKMIHLSEINTIIIETGEVSITSYLINELANNKIKLIFCDEKHNPSSELASYYGSFNTSKKIMNQIEWDKKRKDELWQQIIKHKIVNQARVLEKNKIDGWQKLFQYAQDVQLGDTTNREGHAAKVYFNLLFGKDFVRGENTSINAALDYGYSIILSAINREVVCKGYITPLGINHKNEFNQFNLSCDLMEIFRPIIDDIVFNNMEREFDNVYKMKLIDVLNIKVKMYGKEYFLSNAIALFLKNSFDMLEGKEEKIENYEF